MTVNIVWSLREGVKNPPEPYTIAAEVLAKVEVERQRAEELKRAERFIA